MSRPALGPALVAVSAGGTLGATLRWGVTEAWTVRSDGFPWPVLAINVAGSALLALLPALHVVRRSTLLPVFLGTGVLGGFTTMSAASEEAASLIEAGRSGLALMYAAATLGVALVAVHLVDLLSTPDQRALVRDHEGDE